MILQRIVLNESQREKRDNILRNNSNKVRSDLTDEIIAQITDFYNLPTSTSLINTPFVELTDKYVCSERTHIFDEDDMIIFPKGPTYFHPERVGDQKTSPKIAIYLPLDLRNKTFTKDLLKFSIIKTGFNFLFDFFQTREDEWEMGISSLAKSNIKIDPQKPFNACKNQFTDSLVRDTLETAGVYFTADKFGVKTYFPSKIGYHHSLELNLGYLIGRGLSALPQLSASSLRDIFFSIHRNEKERLEKLVELVK